MKGLLIKDFNLMKNQKNFFLMIIIVGAIMLVSGNDKSFAIAYITMICTLFVVSTISYDEFENGAAFLFSLPITRKLYTTEKYVFGISLAACSWTVSSVIGFIMDYNNGLIENTSEWWICSASFLAMGILAAEIMIPIHIKFGPERSRIAFMFIFGIVAVVVIGLEKVGNAIGFDVAPIIASLQNVSLFSVSLVVIVVVVAAFVVSYSISESLMEKKEY